MSETGNQVIKYERGKTKQAVRERVLLAFSYSIIIVDHLVGSTTLALLKHPR